MEITELYQRIMQRHCLMADHVSRLAELHVEQGHDINALSTLIESPDSEPASSTVPTEVRPPELAPREQWPEIGHTTALEFVGTDDGLILRGTVDVACHEKTSENAEADFLALHPFAPGVRTKFAEWPSAKPPEMGGRKKSEMTAAEWANGPHFLAYVSRTKPFKSMAAGEQNALRDKFVAAQPTDELLNRWGKRFSAFCGGADAS